jgi:hypothetical protein
MHQIPNARNVHGGSHRYRTPANPSSRRVRIRLATPAMSHTNETPIATAARSRTNDGTSCTTWKIAATARPECYETSTRTTATVVRVARRVGGLQDTGGHVLAVRRDVGGHALVVVGRSVVPPERACSTHEVGGSAMRRVSGSASRRPTVISWSRTTITRRSGPTRDAPARDVSPASTESSGRRPRSGVTQARVDVHSARIKPDATRKAGDPTGALSRRATVPTPPSRHR